MKLLGAFAPAGHAHVCSWILQLEQTLDPTPPKCLTHFSDDLLYDLKPIYNNISLMFKKIEK